MPASSPPCASAGSTGGAVAGLAVLEAARRSATEGRIVRLDA
jgi:hypothetical protein